MASKIQKKVCVDCKAVFDVDLDEFEEGDAVSCPECNLEYILVSTNKGSFKLVESKDFEMSEDDDFDSDDDYEYDDD